jgi:phosphoribosyl 1,2-cyclic phosphodiesterase
MQFCVLGSGSKGNTTYVASGDTAILIDAGFSGVEIQRRLAAIGVDFSAIDAILVTHEHNDHIRGVPVLSRRGQLPVYANRGTMEAGSSLIDLHRFHEFETGAPFQIKDLHVHPFAVCHDTRDPVGFVITDDRCSLGYCTDTGRITRLIHHRLTGCQGLILESNHDPELLKNGPYPLFLKQRVAGKEGHLANHEAAAFLRELVHDHLSHVVLAHLSETNNLPSKAREASLAALPSNGHNLQLIIANQNTPTPMISLNK